MDCSLIILNYRSDGLTKYCLQRILASPPRLSYEILVIDNGSPEGGIGSLKTHWESVQEIVWIELPKNRGFNGGNNVGLKRARGNYLIILNPDLVLVPGAIEQLVDFMERHPKAGIAGPKLLNPDRTIQNSCFHFPKWYTPLFRRSVLGKTRAGQTQLEHYLMLDFDHLTNRRVEWLLGACLIVRRSALDVVGLLDERYFLYLGDTDWCRRFWEKGWEVWYVADISLIHYYHRESAVTTGLKGLFNYPARIHLKNFISYLKKFHGKKNPVPKEY